MKKFILPIIWLGQSAFCLSSRRNKGNARERRHAYERGRNAGWRDDDGQDEGSASAYELDAKRDGWDERAGTDEEQGHEGDGKIDG